MAQNTAAALAARRSAGRRPASPRPKSRSNLLGFVLVAPLVVVMAVVIGFPLINTIQLSLQDQQVIGTPSDFVGVETFATVLGDVAMWSALGRSAVWLVANLALQTVLAFATALLLMRTGLWSRTARTWVLLPWVIPTVAVSVIWQWLTNTNYGVVTDLFGAIGIEVGGPFANTTTALFALILVNSWHWFPLAAVVIYGALNTVPVEVLEAAKIDGANAWQTFWSITIPIIQPILFALGLVGSLWAFNIVDQIYLVTEGGPDEASTTAPVYVYDTAFSAFRASEAAAASVVTIVLLGILVYLFFKVARPKDHA